MSITSYFLLINSEVYGKQNRHFCIIINEADNHNKRWKLGNWMHVAKNLTT